jgi:hypothetical protein
VKFVTYSCNNPKWLKRIVRSNVILYFEGICGRQELVLIQKCDIFLIKIESIIIVLASG